MLPKAMNHIKTSPPFEIWFSVKEEAHPSIYVGSNTVKAVP
jgi:hypothetical protein